MKTETDNNTALILAGSGYSLTVSPEAYQKKEALLSASAGVTVVSTNDESADAQFRLRQLAQMRILVDASRKEVKEPVLRIGKQIDAAAKEFLLELEAEEGRIRRLVSDHAMVVAKEAVVREAEERRLALLSNEAKAKADAMAVAAASGRISDTLAAKKAEADRQLALSARMAAAELTAETRIAEGVRFTWDFEVLDRWRLHEKSVGLTDVLVLRSAVLARLKEWEGDGSNENDENDVVDTAKQIGLRAFKKPVVSSR